MTTLLTAPADLASSTPSDKAPEPPQKTSSLPVGVSEQQSASPEVWAEVLKNARRRDGSRKEARKPKASNVHFWRSYQAHKRYAAQPGVRARRPPTDAYARTSLHLGKIALRAMNDLQGMGYAAPSLDELENALYAYLYAELKFLIFGGQNFGKFERWAYLAGDTPERVAHDVAVSIHAKWSVEWIQTKRAEGRYGGTHHAPRRPAWSESDLLVLQLLKGIPQPEIAALTFRSLASVERMVRALKARGEW